MGGTAWVDIVWADELDYTWYSSIVHPVSFLFEIAISFYCSLRAVIKSIDWGS
jgi:hypothetical protein